jgi:hypothetical protein
MRNLKNQTHIQTRREAMKTTHTIVAVALVVAMILVGCSKSSDPIGSSSQATEQVPELEELQACAWPRSNYQAPSPTVRVEVGTESVDFWPYTGVSLTSEPKDPINLVFFGETDPRDIRAALLGLDGDRSAFGMPSQPPFNSTWDDAIGDIQASYGEPGGWTPSAIQLACGDYTQARVHLRLFKVGKWTLGGAHFEVLIPGTTDHQVLSWEVAEQFVTVDFMRSGLLDPTAPLFPTAPINDAPFRTIPAVIYNELPVELRGLIGGPLGDVGDDVPIGTDGCATVLNLAGKAARVAGVRDKDIVIDFNQVIPKPFCSSGPNDYVYVTGPVTLTQTSKLEESGAYTTLFRAQGVLSVTPIDPTTGSPIGETLTAKVRELHQSLFVDRSQSALSIRYQGLYPLNAPGAGWLFERLNVSSRGGDGYQLVTRCESDEIASAPVVERAREIDTDGAAPNARLVSIR